jgi:hypothetical protein
MDQLRSRWPKLAIEVRDLRREVWIRKEQVVVERRPNPEDPRGYVRFDLGKDSLFHGHRGEGRYYGADYDSRVVNSHHRGDVHEYLLAGSPVRCDLFVNLPKLKTHKKTGITCCLKNLVGINGDKNWLPHHTESSPDRGGDEFPDDHAVRRFERAMKRAGRTMALSVPGVGTFLYRKARNVGTRVLGDSERVIRNGNWHGNDTCWRMVLDLNKCLFFFDGNGQPRKKPPRYLAVVDGIIAGEGNGPMSPDPKPCGLVLAGTHPVALDCVAATLMGFDWLKLRLLKNSFQMRTLNFAPFQPGDIEVVSDKPAWTGKLEQMEGSFSFRPHFGWIGAIENTRKSVAA